MTERERSLSTFEKVCKKHPHITDLTALKELAIQKEQGKTLLISIIFILSSMVSMLLYGIVPDNEYNGAFLAVCFVTFIICTFEYFRTISNSVKIRYNFFAKYKAKTQGTVTHAQILRDKKSERDFNESGYRVIKGILYDKDDRDTSGISFIHHKYTLFFNTGDNLSYTALRVKRRAYLTAPLNAEYVLVITDTGNVIAAYLSDNWKIDPSLFDKCNFDAAAHNAVCENNFNMQDCALPRNKTVFEILLLCANIFPYILSAFVPVALFFLFVPASVYFSARFVIKSKTVLSVINAVLGFLNAIFLVICIVGMIMN